MTKNFIKVSIPLWVAIVFLTLVVGIATIVSVYFREIIYKHDIFLEKKDGNIEKLEYGFWPALSNVDFFNNVKREFINNSSDFIEANLSDMKLRVYERGISAGEFDILSKGKKGSWWETPVGLYKVQNKAKEHFSSFGRVYQPWSMVFQGNFFIHGWPYYPDGRVVEPTHSGGCIRLSTEDAKVIYDMVKIGTPIIIFEENFVSDSLKYKIKTPQLSAKNYLAADLKSNFVFLNKSKGENQFPIASLTKLMTALVATEYINLEKEITITKEMITPTSKPRFKVGEEIAVFQLLYPLLMESSNEAAMALAHSLGERYFINLMNQKAEALGMNNTKFVDSLGKSAENISSLENLFFLAKYLYNNRSFILKVSTGNLERSVYGAPIWSGLSNFNVFTENPEFVGGKVGYIEEAKNTILTVFEIDIAGETRPVVIIVLGSEDAAKDVQIILEYIKTSYERNNL